MKKLFKFFKYIGITLLMITGFMSIVSIFLFFWILKTVFHIIKKLLRIVVLILYGIRYYLKSVPVRTDFKLKV